jgi:hypothetical protein
VFIFRECKLLKLIQAAKIKEIKMVRISLKVGKMFRVLYFLLQLPYKLM